MKKVALFLIILGGLLLLLPIWIGFFLSPQNKLEKVDAIVTISGGETVERVNEAVQLYQQGYAPLLIFSGAARDRGVSNAESMQHLAIKSGIPEDKILTEKQAKNTFDNAKFVKDLIQSRNIDSIILVTSPYHQRRTYLTFRHILGPDIKILNHSSEDSAWRKKGWWKDAWARSLTFSELQKILILPVVWRTIGP